MRLTTGRLSKRRQQIILLICLLLALFVTFFFGTRAFRRFRDRPTDEPIREWMNIPYVAHSYQVPPDVLFRSLNLPDKPPPDKRPIRRIAQELNLSVSEVTAYLEEAIAQERASRPPPGGPPSPPTAPSVATPIVVTPVITPAN